jgi:hypothetical protein
VAERPDGLDDDGLLAERPLRLGPSLTVEKDNVDPRGRRGAAVYVNGYATARHAFGEGELHVVIGPDDLAAAGWTGRTSSSSPAPDRLSTVDSARCARSAPVIVDVKKGAFLHAGSRQERHEPLPSWQHRRNGGVMSVTPPARICPVHSGLLRYAADLAGWMLTIGLASYGAVVYVSPPPSTWARQRPRYWRHEAREGLLACEAYLQHPPRRLTGENA